MSGSSREQFIENVVCVVFPNFAQPALGLGKPGCALDIIFQGFDGNPHTRVFRQRERLERTQEPVLVNGFDVGVHAESYARESFPGSRK